ncbi:aldose epimerase family protein [Limosilactobacillus sp.]|jgi:aldose 1-epimerase|uniref:aldose epimerase family protein n=1 Tax=Limosilactobacillus sp. TaxID=2773925 RepID=UPI0025C0162F|nr:aldose epimerase family protein [Limosilactobacillus sp.]MCH3921321.1 galactose mutarotase [Limosilactobacillus sp.]MCH3928092.1 galactose mutarotase [Limosilactobacillus sp.]
MDITKVPFGSFKGDPVTKYVLTNDNGVQASVLDFAGLLQSLKVPTKDGGKADMVLTSENLDEFTNNGFCTNRLIGRVAGRIADGEVQINGHDYKLEQNEGKNTLHGGTNGFYNHIWHVDKTATTADSASITLSLTLSEQDDTFPATIHVTATYTLDNDDNLSLKFGATSDGDTLFNPTNHTYWNMADAGAKTVDGLTLQVNSKHHLAVDDGKIPTGEMIENAGTPFDFSKPTLLGDALKQMASTKENGFDDIWVVEPSLTEPVATLEDKQSGRKMELYSDRNALIMYTMNSDDPAVYNHGEVHPHLGIAMEAQTLSDAPHHPEFGDITLKANEEKNYTIKWHVEY